MGITKNKQELESMIKLVRKDNFDLILICGGDGTFLSHMNIFLKSEEND